jgi:alpha-glucosidase
LPALRRGGLRWVAATGDVLAFLRESPDQRLLILARRAAGEPLHLPTAPLGLANEAPNVFGGAAALRGDGPAVEIAGDGPTFQVWQLG